VDIATGDIAMTTKTFAAISPTGAAILGTYEMCPARAEIACFYRNEDGSIGYDHEGGSEMFWDAMETVTRDGKTVFLDENGDEWTEDQITLVDPDAE
jgi:hypothetical protein